MTAYANPQLLITPADLKKKIDSGDPLLILDARTAESFAKSHIAHAIHIDLWGVSLIDTDPAPLKAFMWMIEHVLQLRGLDAATPVVIYDWDSGLRAARAFWFLEYFGHPHVQVLDGGFFAWAEAQLPVTQEAEAPRKGSSFAAQPQAQTLATWRDVKERLGSRDAVLLDTRSDDEYRGTLVRAARGGAIPGAVHLEWTRNLTPAGRFKSADELKAMYEAVGVTPDKDVVAYCQGGYRAAHSYLALRLLGYPRVRNYVGSWKEWGDREELPIETPR